MLRIGKAAEKAGVSPRTLRYYEELGLLAPREYTDGGARRYEQSHVERIAYIRELQELMGCDLDEIKTILSAEDRLAELREEFRSDGQTTQRQKQIVAEAIEINTKQRELLHARQRLLAQYAVELDEKACKYREFEKSLDE